MGAPLGNFNPSPPTGNNGPVAIARDTAKRIEASTLYYERERRGGDVAGVPRGAGVNPGIYGLVTTAITAISGSNLGSGFVTLCSRVNGALTADGDTGVTVYNAGGAVATGKYISLAWVDGDWSTSVAGC